MRLFEFATKVRDIAQKRGRKFLCARLTVRETIDEHGNEVSERAYFAQITGDVAAGSDLEVLEYLSKGVDDSAHS